MYNQREKSVRNEYSPPMNYRNEEQESVKVYERPARPMIPVWLMLVFIALGMLLMWFFLQAL